MEEKTPVEAVVPTPPVKQPKRGSRASHGNEQVSRSPAKPATLLPRPSTSKPSTILPQPMQKPVMVSNQMTPLVPKPIASNGQIVKPSTNGSSQGFTTYLVVDGNQGQLIQVANDGSKPVTFRNQAGQILQATPITVMPSGNQPALPTTVDPSTFTLQQAAAPVLMTPQCQPVTTIRPTSSMNVQHTTDSTTAPQQLTATSSLLSDCNMVNQPPVFLQSNSLAPTSILNGSSVSTHERDMSPGQHDNDSSIDDTSALEISTTQDPNLSLSLSQIVRKTNHRHRRTSNSSASKKKRGRPRLYERDPFTNKPIKSRATLEPTEVTIPTMNGPTTTLLMPGTLANLHPHPNGCNSLIFPSQTFSHTTTVPVNVNTPSLLQQQPYTYPSLLNGGATPSPSMLTIPTLNILSSNATNSSSPSPYPYSSSAPTTIPSRPFAPPVIHTMENQVTIPLKNLQISSTSSPTTSSPRSSTILPSTTVPSNASPIKSLQVTQSNDVVVHYIGGFVIRESSQPFPADDPNDISKDSNHSSSREKENHSFNDNHGDLGSDQLRCVACKKVDFSERFFNQEKKLCSKACSTKPPKATKTSNGKKSQPDKPIAINEPPLLPESQPASLPPDHGLPGDPSKWSVAQVGQFIGRLTNETIRETFCESEMDGQALLLMTPEHLRETMKIKLGPSLVISSEITKLRERARAFC